ncbi:YqaA family protein [Marinomonas balearica]|uniref:Membrane protein YqaA with SNARE-associated domain n=1 Tax=Marinomonas balearica TaxID=491947 RepID=A0A4R6MDB3_9GAMM|nr:YqaA family protein [Marinomonas balearica]TDO98700.1 membrane protein YqaA with SNARE-associated domain [Marinomonas balearica]
MFDLISLFFSSFLSATVFPGSSEALIIYLSATAEHSLILLWGVASLGNTLGGVTNWVLGRYLFHFRDHKYFPVSVSQLEKASAFFSTYGKWTLLLSWLPVIGDALCLFAGVSKIRLFTFFVLVLFGKSLRYAILLIGIEYI